MSSLSHLNKTIRILIIDDAPINRFVLSKLLESEGYAVYQAGNGKSAVTLAQHHRPILILLDIMMPDMNGYEVCRQLRIDPATANTPIIFLSALDAPFDKVRAFRQGAADYVTKPFQAEEVLARVRHQINLQLAKQAQQQLNSDLESRVQERTQLLEIAHHQLLDLALSDRLTRLPNRLLFVKRLGTIMAEAHHGGSMASFPIGHAIEISTQKNENKHFAVMFLDCDRFKRINDSLGHRVGDQLLKDVGNRLLSIKHEHIEVDTVARFGGDEFALLIVNVPDREAVVAIAHKVLSALDRSFCLAGREIFINASIGLVWGEPTYVAAEHLLRDADVAMYRAKDCNRNQYLWFEAAMHNRAVNLLQLETDLRLALERREFELYYQPIVELKTLKIVGFEALVRWHHPSKGLVSPNDFIEFAEDTGLIIPLGAQLLTMACEHIAQWEQAGLIDPEITVSVNIAAQQLLQPDILAQIELAIETTGIAAHRLRLELTERSILHSHTFVDNVLRALRHRNIHLSIDDFGTGYSALSYLHSLPVNCLKVDRSFVQPITAQSKSLNIVPLIINIAKTMNMQIIAEGIENTTQLRQLQQLGCEYGQGYLFQKAVPAERVMALFSQPLVIAPSSRI